MTLQGGKFRPPPLNFPATMDLRRRTNSRWDLPQIFSFKYFLLLSHRAKLTALLVIF